MPTSLVTSFTTGDVVQATHVSQYATPLNNVESGSAWYRADTGTANAYKVSFASGNVISSYAPGQLVFFKAANSNTGASTLQVTGPAGDLATKPITKNGGAALASGDIQAGQIVGVIYNDQGTGRFELVGAAGAGGGASSLPALSDVADSLAYTARFALVGDGSQYVGRGLEAADIQSGSFDLARMPAGGTNAQFLRGDKTWSDLFNGHLTLNWELRFGQSSGWSGSTVGAAIFTSGSATVFNQPASWGNPFWFANDANGMVSIGAGGVIKLWAATSFTATDYGWGRTTNGQAWMVPSGKDYRLGVGGSDTFAIDKGGVKSGLGDPNLIEPVYKTRTLLNAGAGTSDLSGPASGKRWLVQSYRFVNVTGGSITATIQIFSGAAQTVAQIVVGAGQTLSGAVTMPILESGEKLYINVNASGLHAFFQVLEFATASNLKSAKLLSLAAGNNTLYTCPSGKTAIAVGWDSAGRFSRLGNNLFYRNDSGSTRTIYANHVPSGGSVVAPGSSTSNALTASTVSVAASVLHDPGTALSLEAGDFININTDANTAFQTAWINIVEH